VIRFWAAGTLLGLSAGFSPGPLLTLVLSQSLRYGSREGVKVAVAPLLTDVPIVAVALFLLTRAGDFAPVLGGLSIGGAAFVGYLAWASLRTKGLEFALGAAEPRSVRKGAAVNALNPHPYLFWLAVGGPTLLQAWAQSAIAAVGFAACFWGCLVGSKALLAVVVGRTKHLLSDRAYALLMRVLGVLLLFFAAVLLKDGLVLLGLRGGGAG
jgi:threonine/homoserine/homoserine lactone efflux protein